jgi:putative ABC transport system permease protein
MHEQPLISIITIVGTALSLFLIMLVVMTQQVKVVPFSPESNRERTQHVRFLSLVNGEGEINATMSLSFIDNVYKCMKTPEAVTAYVSFTSRQPLSVQGSSSFTADLKMTDAAFWRVFDFNFIEGRPYNEAEFKAGMPLVVIDRTTARRLFGADRGVAGRTFSISHTPCKVAGVVNDVSVLASVAYAQVWIPYTTNKETCSQTWDNANVSGSFSVTLLARNKGDMAKMHDEAVANVNKFNMIIKSQHMKINNRNRPYTTEKDALDFSANNEPNVASAHLTRFLIFLILLIVPAINLSSMTHSRLRQRITEIGIRRAFGCTRWSIANQILTENMIVTLCAGLIGLILSIITAYCFNATLFTPSFSDFSNPPLVNIGILLHLSTFGYALLFCFVLNLLSAGIPVIHACRTSIINDLNRR